MQWAPCCFLHGASVMPIDEKLSKDARALKEASDAFDAADATPLDPATEAMLGNIFAELFSEVPLHARKGRRVPLVVRRGYRGLEAESTHEVRYRRRSPCDCARSCEKCHWVGWFVEEERPRVTIPAGVDIGVVLRLPNMGDVAIVELPQDIIEAREGGLRGRVPTPLEVEVVDEDSARAEELLADQRELERRLDVDLREARQLAEVRRRQAKLSRNVFFGLIAVVVAALALYLTG